MAGYLLFCLSGQVLALPGDAVREIVLRPRLWQPPGQPAVLAGVMNLRGLAVPVVRLERLLGLEAARPGLFAPLIVLRRPVVWAVTADAALDVADGGVLPAAGGNFNQQVVGRLSTAGREAILLSPERLLAAEETAVLIEFQQMAMRRREDWVADDTP